MILLGWMWGCGGGPCDLDGRRYDDVSQSHVDGDVAYDDEPPAGGSHNPCWAPWGMHVNDVVAPENFVHNLEHGGVVFLWDCDDCAADLATVGDTVDQLGAWAMGTRYPGLPWPFAAVAWGVRAHATCVDADAMTRFYTAHVDRAPESTPSDPPAGCIDDTDVDTDG